MPAPAADLIHAEIHRTGPISFERFMELALYAPGAGYYTSTRDPFGIHGDFYTAAQLQPVFGILIERLVGQYLRRLGTLAIADLGAGRREMASAFAASDYTAVEVDGELPRNFNGVVFANEFFDALPVQLYQRCGDVFREMRVAGADGKFTFQPSSQAPMPAAAAYLARYAATAPANALVEVNLRALEWARSISRSVRHGTLLVCDYGYTSKELMRFPQGTLMTYRRHAASEDVLQMPGERDITAHVAWTPLIDAFTTQGWTAEPLTTLARALLSAGEADQFEEVFRDCGATEEMRRRMQLKTLLFGMGEAFQMLVLHK